jgi:hypothetical protein
VTAASSNEIWAVPIVPAHLEHLCLSIRVTGRDHLTRSAVADFTSHCSSVLARAAGFTERRLRLRARVSRPLPTQRSVDENGEQIPHGQDAGDFISIDDRAMPDASVDETLRHVDDAVPGAG